MANPWDVAPWPDQGNETADEIFRAVGEALSSWELIEQGIATIFTVVTVGGYYAASEPAIRAYGSVANSRSRVQMVRAAAESWFHQWPDCPLETNIKDLLNECEKWSARRNEIAHGIVDRLTDQWINGWYLFPGLYSIKKRPLGGRAAYRYTAKNIEEYARGFTDLYNRLSLIVSALEEWRRIAASRELSSENGKPKT
jgi:hypothetical protein